MYSSMSKEAWPDWKAEEGKNAEEVRIEPSRGGEKGREPSCAGESYILLLHG